RLRARRHARRPGERRPPRPGRDGPHRRGDGLRAPRRRGRPAAAPNDFVRGHRARLRGAATAMTTITTKLPPNPIHHFYRGGPAIARLRGFPLESDHTPEEWIGSTATLFGESQRGLSTLPDGTLLRDAIAADPEAWLGAAHVERFGADPALL